MPFMVFSLYLVSNLLGKPGGRGLVPVVAQL